MSVARPRIARPPPVPDARGRFGAYGGRYVPEVLIPALDELAEAWATAPRRRRASARSSAR